MTTIASLQQARTQKAAEMRALVTTAETASRDLSETETRRFDALEAEVRGLDTTIARHEKLAELERRAEARPVDGESRELDAIAARFKIGEAVADHCEGRELRGAARDWNQANRSRRAGGFTAPTSAFMGGSEQRALTTGAPSGGPGANLIATTQGPFIDRLRPVLAVKAMGALVLPGLTGPVDLPRQKASGTAHWVAEHAATTRSDPQFDKVEMGPKTVSAEYEVSRKMLLQSTSLDAILRLDLGQMLAQALDLAAIAGTGTDQPTGILGTSGVFTHAGATNGKALDLDLAADLIGALDGANVNGARGFLTNAKARKAAMKLRDSTGQPFGVPAVFGNEAVTFSNQVPGNLTKGTGTNLSAVIYGAWADLIVAYWSSVDILVNPYHSDVASKGGVLMHAFLDADIAVRHPESFAVAKDVIA